MPTLYLKAIRSHPHRVERVPLPIGEDGEYTDLPAAVAASTFDRSDRQFAAVGHRVGVPVVNATDSDWLDHLRLLEESGINVEFLCGFDRRVWFDRGQPTSAVGLVGPSRR